MTTTKHPLAHLIPDPAIAAGYISRRVGGVAVSDSSGNPTGAVQGGEIDLNVLNYCWLRSQSDKRLCAPRLIGPTGSGKSHVVLAFAATKGLPVVTLQCSEGFDALSVFGRYIPSPSGSGIEWQDSEILTVIKEGGILYLDEINFLTGSQTAVFHSLLDSRRGVNIIDLGNIWVEAHADLFVVATYNENYEGTRRLNEAFQNRFQLPIEWGYDEAVELALTGSESLVKVANEIRTLHRAGAISTTVPTNALTEFCTFAYDIDVVFALEGFLQRFPQSERASVRERLLVEDLLQKIATEIADHNS
ncbi:AAA domain containing protein [uncultured Caudovirales phage]|uniref:AAA domain containing protein n=1 Tax=uncultured Caudovirales phage TaxID=2100421 RepID=A0A6J5RNB4_9CAUD|nr:AAA domain containing protein [uncultured Caudovirales phage]